MSVKVRWSTLRLCRRSEEGKWSIITGIFRDQIQQIDSIEYIWEKKPIMPHLSCNLLLSGSQTHLQVSPPSHHTQKPLARTCGSRVLIITVSLTVIFVASITPTQTRSAYTSNSYSLYSVQLQHDSEQKREIFSNINWKQKGLLMDIWFKMWSWQSVNFTGLVQSHHFQQQQAGVSSIHAIVPPTVCYLPIIKQQLASSWWTTRSI